MESFGIVARVSLVVRRDAHQNQRVLDEFLRREIFKVDDLRSQAEGVRFLRKRIAQLLSSACL